MFTTIIKIIFTLSTILGDVPRVAEAARKYAPGELTAEAATIQAKAALLVGTPEVPPELLLSMAFVESRYDTMATSRLEDGVRKTGIPLWQSPPSNVSGPYYCGVTQAEAGLSWQKCLRLRDILVSYQTTVQELTRWLRSPSCRSEPDRMQCALWGYGGGHPAIKAKTSTYPYRVLFRAAAIRRAIAPRS